MPDRLPIAVRVICGQAVPSEEEHSLAELPYILPADLKTVRDVLVFKQGFVPPDPVGLDASDLKHLSVVDRSQLGGGKERGPLPTISRRPHISEDRPSWVCREFLRRTPRRRWEAYRP